MKRLTLLRHAKSSWNDVALDDFDRPLNKRGRRDAPLMGKRLAPRGVFPDRIISSPAERAFSTAQAIAGALGYPEAEISRVTSMYEAGGETLLGLVRGLNEDLTHVMLVGHNPSMTDFANYLSSAEPIGHIPTCGIVTLEIDAVSWRGVSRGSGTVVYFDYPKKTNAGE